MDLTCPTDHMNIETVDLSSLSPADSSLLQEARAGLSLAYSPYSGNKTGVALLTASGKHFIGGNIGNSCSTLNCCAEQVALNLALMAGERQFKALGLVTASGDLVVPCGRCLQLLSEFSRNIRIVAASPNCAAVLELEHLLPIPYRRPACE